MHRVAFAQLALVTVGPKGMGCGVPSIGERLACFDKIQDLQAFWRVMVGTKPDRWLLGRLMRPIMVNVADSHTFIICHNHSYICIHIRDARASSHTE